MGLQSGTGMAMRIAILFYAGVGIALIVFGCLLQNPPSNYAPAFAVALGSINLFASAAGFWGSYNKKRVLLVFLVFGTISALLQIIFCITLLTNFDTVLDKILDHTQIAADKRASERVSIGKQLNVMRWALIGFIFVELLTLVLAILLKWVIKDDDPNYQGFTEEANEQRMLGMGALRSDIESNVNKGGKSFDKLRHNIGAKYGAALHGVGGWKSKAQVSWARG